jgi:hypothetical protein
MAIFLVFQSIGEKLGPYPRVLDAQPVSNKKQHRMIRMKKILRKMEIFELQNVASDLYFFGVL